MTEDEMGGWHHRLNGQEFEQSLVMDRKACMLQSWDQKEWDATQRLN